MTTRIFSSSSRRYILGFVTVDAIELTLRLLGREVHVANSKDVVVFKVLTCRGVEALVIHRIEIGTVLAIISYSYVRMKLFPSEWISDRTSDFYIFALGLIGKYLRVENISDRMAFEFEAMTQNMQK